jgi:UDPglucose 6-dehydrogenase
MELSVERVFIVGSGVVGRATGVGLAQAGHAVTFIDVSAERVAMLGAQGLDARPQLSLHGEPDSYIFLTLPTPTVGRQYDLTILETGVRSVGNALQQSSGMHTVVARSTVPPGTVEDLVRPLLEQASGKRAGSDFHVASNPEFLRARSADEDFRWPRVTVIGARNKRIQERLADLLSPFGGEIRVFDDPATTEMIKCVHNAYNASKISFWNEIWQLCRRIGVNHDDVAMTVAHSAEASFNERYGIRGGEPYGGACLPKDANGLLGFAQAHDVGMPLLEAVVTVNEVMGTLAEGFAAGVRDALAQVAAVPAAPSTAAESGTSRR